MLVHGTWHAAPSNSANYVANKERGGNRAGRRRIIKGRLPPDTVKRRAPTGLSLLPSPPFYNRLARRRGRGEKEPKRW